jgi:hypothetical protein
MAGWSLMNFYFLFHHMTILPAMKRQECKSPKAVTDHARD